MRQAVEAAHDQFFGSGSGSAAKRLIQFGFIQAKYAGVLAAANCRSLARSPATIGAGSRVLSSNRGSHLARDDEARLEMRGRHRLAEEVALPLLAAHTQQQIGDGAAFDAFGDDRKPQLPA